MPARARVLDFSDVDDPGSVGGKHTPKHQVIMGKSRSERKQIRGRIRRRGKVTKAEFEMLYKPLEEWDPEELARGRPRNKAGDFRGAAPSWITREMHEAILTRFKEVVRSEMRAHTIPALKLIETVLTDDTVDLKGRPMTPMSTRVDAAKFLIEHMVGKPKVHQEVDISVKLQALLATAVASPVDMGGRELMAAPVMPTVNAFAEAFGTGDAISNDYIDVEPEDEDYE